MLPSAAYLALAKLGAKLAASVRGEQFAWIEPVLGGHSLKDWR